MVGRPEAESAGLAAESRPLGGEVFRALFERSPEAILLVGADGRCLDANPTACALLGYLRTEVPGLAPDRLVDGQLPRGGGLATVCLSLRHRAGHLIPVHAKTADLGDHEGVVTAVFLAQVAASECAATGPGEAGYRSLVEHLPVVTYVEEVRPGGASHRSYTSPQIEALIGVTPAEWAADPNLWERILHPADRDRVLAEDARSNATGEPFRCDYRVRARDGRDIWVRDWATRIETRADGVQIWQGVVLDISEEKRTQEVHRRSEARFRALVQNATDIVSIVDRDGIRRFVSPGVERVLGYAPAEQTGVSVEDHLAAADLARFRRLWAEAAARPGVPACAEVRVRHKDGSWRWLETTATNCLDDPDIEGIVFNTRDVTERIEAEAVLREAERRAQAYLEQLPVLVYVQRVDDPDQTTYVNPWCETLFGLGPATWTASWKERVHPDDRPGVEREVARTDATGEPFRLEYRERTAGGRYLWVRDEAVLVRDDAGTPRYWIGAKVDVSDRREAEAALRASEALYRSLVEELPAAVYVDPPDRLGAPVYASPRITTLLGYAPEAWQSDPDLWASRIHPDDRERVLAEHAHANATGEPLLSEFRFIARDGRIVWVRDEAVLVRDEQGRPRNWHGVVVDVTERRVAEELLREAEARYRTLVEQLPVVVSIHALDPTASALYVSPQFERVFGFTVAEVESNPSLWLEITHPEDLGRILVEMERAAAGSGRLSIEYRQRTRDGRWLWLQENSVLLRDDQGVPQRWQTVLTDVTGLKRAQEAAEAANALKSTFLSSMSHELRTPLNAIIGHTHLLLDGYEGELPAAQRPSLEIVAHAADHLLALIDDVLDLSRIEAEALELAPERLDVAAVVEAVLAVMDAQATAKGLALRVDVEPGLEVEADAVRLRQILLNLVGNAVKFTEQGEVRVAARSLDAGVEVSVVDTGIGIAAEFLPHVFDEFRQADPSTTRRYGGSGLGLAIVRRLVELHGGTIAVTSEPGIGSTFVVTLPDPPARLHGRSREAAPR